MASVPLTALACGAAVVVLLLGNGPSDILCPVSMVHSYAGMSSDLVARKAGPIPFNIP